MKLAAALLAFVFIPFAALADDAPGPQGKAVTGDMALDGNSWIPTKNGRFTVIEEDDTWSSHDDRHYTHGIRFSYLTPALSSGSKWNGTFAALDEYTPLFSRSGDISRHADIMIGQNMYTPSDIHLRNPDPTDRPYAGWLYTGVGLMQDNASRSLDHVELLVGVVGPWSYARQVQNNFHKFVLQQPTAHGWEYQVKNEPAAMLTFERTWRVHPINAQWIELLPEAGLTGGNVMSYAHTGVTLRIGKGLNADYGQAHIRPGTSGSDYFNGAKIDDRWGAYWFVSTQGRALANNIFLNGNTFQDSRNVDMNHFVADFTTGLSVFWTSGLKLDYMAGLRTREFDHQKGLDRLGGINLAYQF